MKINGTATKMLVDSGAQFTVLGEREFHSLLRSGLKAKLQPEERNLRGYGNGCLPVVGKFEATIECHGQTVTERAVRETKRPTNVAELRSFLGLITFSSRFLPNFATTAEPLRTLTRQDTKWKWGKEENEAFEALKRQLAEASMMAFYDKNAPTGGGH